MKLNLLAILLASLTLNQASAEAIDVESTQGTRVVTETPAVSRMAQMLVLYPSDGVPSRTLLLARMLHGLGQTDDALASTDTTPPAYPSSDQRLLLPLGQYCCVAASGHPVTTDEETR